MTTQKCKKKKKPDKSFYWVRLSLSSVGDFVPFIETLRKESYTIFHKRVPTCLLFLSFCFLLLTNVSAILDWVMCIFVSNQLLILFPFERELF